MCHFQGDKSSCWLVLLMDGPADMSCRHLSYHILWRTHPANVRTVKKHPTNQVKHYPRSWAKLGQNLFQFLSECTGLVPALFLGFAPRPEKGIYSSVLGTLACICRHGVISHRSLHCLASFCGMLTVLDSMDCVPQFGNPVNGGKVVG